MKNRFLCNNYTMAARDLPEIYTQSPRVYISGKSQAAMVKLIYFTWLTQLQVRNCYHALAAYLYWTLKTSTLANCTMLWQLIYIEL